MPYVHYVAVLHNVLLAFEAKRAAGAGGGFRARVEQRVPADGLGADEVMLEVGVDGSGTLRGFGASGNGPGAALVFAGGEEADEAQQLIALADEADEAALMQTIAAQKIRGFRVVHLGELGLD